MSDAPMGPGWWLASDGKWYPPQPQAPMPPPRPPMPPPPFRGAPAPASERPFYKRTWFIVLAALFAIGLVGSLMAPPEEEEGRDVALAAVDLEEEEAEHGTSTTEQVTSTTAAPATTAAPTTTTPPTTAPPTTAPPTTAPPPTTAAPPPPPPPAPPTTVARAPEALSCTPGYDPCIPPTSDADCAGGEGDGPTYVNGPVSVSGSDPYDLDRDGDGVGCES